MTPRTTVRPGGLATITLALGLIAAVVLFFVVPDQRYIAGIVVAITLLDALVMLLVLPRVTSERGVHSEIDRLNAEAEALDAADDAPPADAQ